MCLFCIWLSLNFVHSWGLFGCSCVTALVANCDLLNVMCSETVFNVSFADVCSIPSISLHDKWTAVYLCMHAWLKMLLAPKCCNPKMLYQGVRSFHHLHLTWKRHICTKPTARCIVRHLLVTISIWLAWLVCLWGDWHRCTAQHNLTHSCSFIPTQGFSLLPPDGAPWTWHQPSLRR